MKKLFLCTLAVLILILPFGISSFAVSGVSVSAKAAIVYEPLSGQILFEKNIRQKLPMASTTKILTTLLLLENGNLDEEFTVDSEAIKTEGSSMGLTEGDIVTGRALAIGMLLPSGNDAANASAVRVSGNTADFAALMNRRAELIGMKDSHFVTPSGLHDENHYSTAYDMALLTAEALKNPDFREICGSSVKKLRFGNPPFDRYLKNTNKLLKMYDGVIGVKTGFTDEAGRCLVSACERDGVTLICVTLNDRNDWNDHIALYENSFSRISPVLLDAGQYAENVVGSEKESILISQRENVVFPSVDGKNPSVEYKIIAPRFVYAPVNENDPIGKAQIFTDGKLFAEVPLYADENADYQSSDGASSSD